MALLVRAQATTINGFSLGHFNSNCQQIDYILRIGNVLTFSMALLRYSVQNAKFTS